MQPGTEADLREKVRGRFNGIVEKFRQRYPDKPIMVSESGCGGEFGRRGEYASPNTEEFQNEYLTDIFETLWANPDVVGFSIWQMNDGRTRERFGGGGGLGVFRRIGRGCFRPLAPSEAVGRNGPQVLQPQAVKGLRPAGDVLWANRSKLRPAFPPDSHAIKTAEDLKVVYTTCLPSCFQW